MTDLPTLLAELGAAVEKMTPGPWFVSGPFPNASIYEGCISDYNRYDPDSGQLPPKWIAQGAYRCAKNIAEDHDIEGIVALVNAYPALREAIEQLQQQLETSRMSEVEQAKRRGELGLEVVKLRRECDEARARAIRWNNEHATAEDRWVEERDALRALVERQREALLGLLDYAGRNNPDDACENARAVLAAGGAP